MSTCRWVAADQPRVVSGRHQYGCDDPACPGCQPCTEAHCRVCYFAHVDGTCAECMAETRESLRDIARMCDALPEEVEHRGVEGEAMMLLGPVTDPERWGHTGASVACGRLPADWVERGIGERHPNTVLLTWQMLWRDALEHDDAGDSELATAVDYLDRTMGYMGGYDDVPFEDFARDLRDCRRHMEAVLHDGEQVERGAPCPECHRPLTHTWGPRVVDDRWLCTNGRCDVEGYTTSQYRGWVEDDARNNAVRLTAEDMALRFTNEHGRLKASVVRVWGSRGLVRKRGSDHHGMTLYDVADVQVRLAGDRESA